jgi:hypothetical protein
MNQGISTMFQKMSLANRRLARRVLKAHAYRQDEEAGF